MTGVLEGRGVHDLETLGLKDAQRSFLRAMLHISKPHPYHRQAPAPNGGSHYEDDLVLFVHAKMLEHLLEAVLNDRLFDR